MERSSAAFQIAGREIGEGQPTYFIADIAANHDGDLERAIALIHAAKAAGADAAKFQHFTADSIVSGHGFATLGGQLSHQAAWKKSVVEVYREATVSLDWSPALKKACDDAGITFFTSPYAFELVDHIDPYVPAYKIGSGDITWIEMIQYIAAKQKPYILATGASSLEDITRAVSAALAINTRFALLQCNTNYTASIENFRFVQLNVLASYRRLFPGVILGLSDHTPGHSTVLGAVALGARIVEKHFTDDTGRQGPDHRFSMDPGSWREMVDRTRELEAALGDGVKRIEPNERDTVVVQRRAIRAARALEQDAVLRRIDLTMLRPCPADAIPPYQVEDLIGRKLRHALPAGELVRWSDLV